MKNKIFLLISILLFLTLIGTAALCNNCGITPATESKSTDAAENKEDKGNEKTKEDLIKEQEEKAKLAEMESIQERDAKIKQEAVENEPYEESGGESGPSVLSMSVPCVVSEGGYIAHDGSPIDAGGYPYIGDSSTNEYCSGYVSFDITGLPTPNIHTASLTFTASQIWGNPSFYTSFGIFTLYYGPVTINTENFSADHNLLEYIDFDTGGNFTIDNDAVKTELQGAIDAGRPRFQIEMNPLSPWTNNDNAWDGIMWAPNGITLNITYLH